MYKKLNDYLLKYLESGMCAKPISRLNFWRCRGKSLTIDFKTNRYIQVSIDGKYLRYRYMLKTCFADFPESLSLEKVNRIRMHIGLSSVKNLD